MDWIWSWIRDINFWRYYRITRSNKIRKEEKNAYWAEKNKKRFHSILSEEGSYNADKNNWRKCHQNGDDIPLDNCLSSICLLRISRWEDVEVSSNDEWYTSDKWNRKKEDSCKFVKNLCKCFSSWWNITCSTFMHRIHITETNCKIKLCDIIIRIEVTRAIEERDASQDGIKEGFEAHNYQYFS